MSHSSHQRANRPTGNPSLARPLAAGGLPHVMFLRQPLVQPLFDDAEEAFGMRTFLDESRVFDGVYSGPSPTGVPNRTGDSRSCGPSTATITHPRSARRR